MRRTLIVVTLFIAFSSQVGNAQTICLRDINRFLCKFKLRDTLPKDAFDSTRVLHPDLTRVVEWKLDYIDCNGDRWSASQPPRERNCEWFYLDAAKQDGRVWIRSGSKALAPGTYRYYVLWDVEGNGDSSAVLSLWMEVGLDSLMMLFAQESHFGGNRSQSWVEKAANFPDGTILLCVHEGFADADECYDKFSFLRGESAGDLKPFYIRQSSQDSAGQLNYDFTNVPWGFCAIETSVFLGEDSSGAFQDDPRDILDSASSRVIDLWEIAKDSLGLDSTKIDHTLQKPYPPVAPRKK